MDKIFVENLRINCIIGILEEERIKEQPLIVSLEMEKDLEKCGRTGQLDASINYAAVCGRVKEYVISRRALLLEELAVELCDLILSEFAPASVTIKLSKPKAVADAEGVGIQITRRTGVNNVN